MPARATTTRWAEALGLRAGAWTARLHSGTSLDGSLDARVGEARRAQHDAALLHARQTSRLRVVLSAAATAPAHAETAGLLAERGGAPRGSAGDLLSGLPILTKDRVRHGLRSLLVPRPGPVDVRITSGTSGDATQIARPRSATVERAAVDRRLFDALGMPAFFTLAVVVPWRQEPVDSWGLIDWRIRLRQVGFGQVTREFDARAARPAELVMTSPAMCALLTERLTGAPPTVSAWEVPRPVRALLGLATPGPAESRAEMYIAAEMTAPIAIRYPDCPSLHVNSDAVYVEAVDPHTAETSPPGTPGLLVLTDLLNTSMPFVRYQIGDVGLVAEERTCPCGRVTPVMTVLGRAGARTAAARAVASELTTAGRWLLVEHDGDVPVLLSDTAADTPHDSRLHSVRPLPDQLRGTPTGGLVVSIRERHPLDAWKDRPPSDLRAGAAPCRAPVERGR